MNNVDLIVLEVADFALSTTEFLDKARFYQYLNTAYDLKPEEIADNFDTFHKAIQQFYGSEHYKIEQLMIRALHERTKQGIYAKSSELEAFNKMVNVFAAEMQTNLKEHREIKDIIAQSKQLRSQVNETQKKLREAERLATIGTTAGMVGHDIRNPLQAMTGDVYLIRSELESIPEGASRDSISESLDSLEQNIAYVNKIVSDLQDYAKPLKPDYTLLNLANLVNELLKTINFPKNITVSMSLRAPPPPKLRVRQLFLGEH